MSWLLLILGQEILWATSLRLQPWRGHIPAFLALFGGLLIFYFIAVRRLRRSPPPFGWVLGAAVLFRATAFLAPPSLSDDVYRYLWDGRVQLAGVTPYRHAPDAPALASLRTPDWTSINHRSLPTIYPPLAQLVFAAGARLHPTITMQRLLFLIFDLLTALLLALHLRARGRPPADALIYAWHPLAVVEFASSGHLDSLGIAVLTAGLLLWERGRARAAGTAWGLSVLGKLGGFILLPWMMLRRDGRRALPAFLVTILLGYALYTLPPLGDGRFPLGSAPTYAATWSFNASLFDLLHAVLRSGIALRVLIGTLLAALSVVMALRRPALDPAAQAGILIAAALALSPVVHPWYALWLLPFLCLFPFHGGLLWTGLVALSYLVWPRYDAGLNWTLPNWVRWIEYGLPATVLVWEIRRRHRP